MPFKTWAEGDLAEDDAYDGGTSYSTIEAHKIGDFVNKSDINRPLRNLFENVIETYNFGQLVAEFTGMKKGVMKDSLTSEFTFDGDSDIFAITVTATAGDTTMYYARLAPGVAVVNGQMVVSRPQTHIAERQLEEIFSLDSWDDEGVQINYFYNTDKFQARITRRDINGTPQDYDFVNSGSWGDSNDGYDTGLAMLAAIYADTTNFRDEFEDAVAIDLTQIELEPVRRVEDGDSVWWIARSTGVIEGDTIAGAAGDLDLCHFTVANGDSYSVAVDDRTYLQDYNDVGRYLYLNVPQEWGDTDTADISDPYGDASVDYSQITNQNTLITFLRKSSGDTQDNSIFGWYEDTIPDIDVTRSDKFFMNKDLLVLFGDSLGDTLGKRWASVGELSGDSWAFYGNKIFNDGFFRFDGDDVHIDSGDSVRIDADNGIFLGENSGTLIGITPNGQIDIDAATGKILDITGDTVVITTDELDIDSTLTTIDGDTLLINLTSELDIKSDNFTVNGDSFVLNSSLVDLNLNHSGDTLIAEQFITFKIQGTNGGVEATNLTLAGTNVTLSGGTNLNISGNPVVSGTLTIGDTLACKMGDTTDVTGFVGDSYGGTQGTYFNGNLVAFKVYNAIWNDYAEGFEYHSLETPQPGLVYKQTSGGLMRTDKRAEKATIGVYSDTAGMIMGSQDLMTETNPKGTKIPIGLAGKVKVTTCDIVEIGDLLVSGENGWARKANFFDKIFRQDRIIGKVLEAKSSPKIEKIWMLIK